jgi:hypothetical protein
MKLKVLEVGPHFQTPSAGKDLIEFNWKKAQGGAHYLAELVSK